MWLIRMFMCVGTQEYGLVINEGGGNHEIRFKSQWRQVSSSHLPKSWWAELSRICVGGKEVVPRTILQKEGIILTGVFYDFSQVCCYYYFFFALRCLVIGFQVVVS